VAWNNLGIVLAAVGRLDEAIAAHRTALELCRRAGDHPGQGLALIRLGHALYDNGNPAGAIHQYGEAIAVFADAGDAKTADEIREGVKRIKRADNGS
jgi:tetratricopeptide (TPR) repeat protein